MLACHARSAIELMTASAQTSHAPASRPLSTKRTEDRDTEQADCDYPHTANQVAITAITSAIPRTPMPTTSMIYSQRARPDFYGATLT
jgi:hypothetical protein